MSKNMYKQITNKIEEKPLPKLVMRDATDNIKLETEYCSKCKKTNINNIGTLVCVNCNKDK